MDHMKLTDELRQQLMEAAVWKNDEISARLDESSAVEEVEEAADGTQEVVHPSGKKLTVTHKQAAARAKYAKTGKGKGIEDDTEYEDGEDAEELEEAAHVVVRGGAEVFHGADDRP